MNAKPERITEDDVRHVAKLSRLKLSDKDIHAFTEQLGDVLTYIAKLNELDVENVEPMVHARDTSNVLRDDVAQPGLSVEQALANAPAAEGPFFKVPKVLGEGSA